MNKKLAIIVSSVVLAIALITTLVIFLAMPKERTETYEYDFKVEYYDQEDLIGESEFKGNDINSFEPSELTVAGKVVEAWYFDESFNKELRGERIKLELVDNTLKLYGKFKLETFYEVTITTYLDDKIYHESVESVIESGLFELPEAMVIEGATFIGWFLNGEELAEKEVMSVDKHLNIELRYKKNEVPEIHYNVEFTLFDEIYSSQERKEGLSIFMPYDVGDEIMGEDGLLHLVTGFSYIDEKSGEIKEAKNGMKVNQNLSIIINLTKVQKIEISWGFNNFATSTVYKTGDNYIELSELEINKDFQNILDSGYEFYYRHNGKLYRTNEFISVEFNYSEPILLEAIEVPGLVYELIEKVELSALNSEQLFVRQEFSDESSVINGTTTFNIKDEDYSDRLATDVTIDTNRDFINSWIVKGESIYDHVMNSDVNLVYETQEDKRQSNDYTLIGQMRVLTNMTLNDSFDIMADTVKNQRLRPLNQESERDIYTRPDAYSANYSEEFVRSLGNFDNLFIKGAYNLEFLRREGFMNSNLRYEVEGDKVLVDLKDIENDTLFGKFIEHNIAESIEDSDEMSLTIQKIDGEFVMEIVNEYITKNFEMYREIGFSSATSGAIVKGTSITRIYL